MDNSLKINEINNVIQNYFILHKEINKVRAKDLMPEFIKFGVFKNDYVRKGLPIRNTLRMLDKMEALHLIPNVKAERKAKNTYWFFIRL